MLLATLLALPAQTAAELPFVTTTIEVPRGQFALYLADLDGDGDQDLLEVSSAGYRARLQTEDRRFVQDPGEPTPWPSERLAWDCADLDGDGSAELLLLAPGRVLRVDREANGFSEPRELLEVEGWLPRGVQRARLARDVDMDGRPDLVVPRADAHQLFLALAEGWSPPTEIQFQAEVSSDFGDRDLAGQALRQDVTIPWFQVADVDGDGVQDLVSVTEERAAFHLGGQRGFESTPTWELDLEALRNDLAAPGSIDLDDLLATVGQRVDWRIVDLDGKAPLDLVLVVGNRLRTWLGGARTGPAGPPSQVLSFGGTLVWFFVRQASGSPLPELQIVRSERISLARVLRTLILPGKLEFDLFTYGNEAGAWSPRPVRSNKISFEIPRLLSMIGDDGLGKEIESRFRIPARRVPGEPGELDDVVDLRDAQLSWYAHCAPPTSQTESLLDGAFSADAFVEGFLLEDLDRGGNGAEKVLDLGSLDTFEFSPGLRLRRATGGREPVFTLELPPSDLQSVSVRDLSPAPGADVIAISRGEEIDVVTFILRGN